MPSLLKLGSAMPDFLPPRVPFDADNAVLEMTTRMPPPAVVPSVAGGPKTSCAGQRTS